jgi:hypothetical protein
VIRHARAFFCCWMELRRARLVELLAH